jgi:RES domain
MKDGKPSRMQIATDGARFNPFPGFPNANIPTLYAGTTEHAAALESVFHDVEHIPNPTYPENKLADFAMSYLTLSRPIKVLKLVNDQLRQVAVPGRPESLLEDEIKAHIHIITMKI